MFVSRKISCQRKIKSFFCKMSYGFQICKTFYGNFFFFFFSRKIFFRKSFSKKYFSVSRFTRIKRNPSYLTDSGLRTGSFSNLTYPFFFFTLVIIKKKQLGIEIDGLDPFILIYYVVSTT